MVLYRGMAYEALNNAGHYKDRIIVVLNDNEMSISKTLEPLHAIWRKFAQNQNITQRGIKFESGYLLFPWWGSRWQSWYLIQKLFKRNALP